MKSRLGAILVALLLAGHAALAQNPGPRPAPRGRERRVVPGSVVYAHGSRVEGLTPANFRGKQRGKPVKILSAELDSSPRDIAVVIDLAPRLEEGGGLPL